MFLKQIAFLSLSVRYHVSFILSSLPNDLQLAVASHTSLFLICYKELIKLGTFAGGKCRYRKTEQNDFLYYKLPCHSYLCNNLRMLSEAHAYY